jgi:hypothetical protein
MASSMILDVTLPTSWAAKTPRAKRRSGLWASGHRLWETAGYALTGVIVLAIAPVLFVTVDHSVAVQWTNAIFDLVSLH